MRPGVRVFALVTALLATAACRAGSDAADTAAADAGMTQFDHAVAAARALQGNAAAEDSILAAHGFTRAAFDALMYEIAADSARSRAYAEAIR